MKYYLLSTLLLPVLIFGQTISPPAISHESGFYTEEFYLTITHPDPTVTILYTLDGSEPKIENLTGKVWNYKKQYPTNPGDPVGDLLQDTIWTYAYAADSMLVRDRSNESDRISDISTSYYTNNWYNTQSKQDSSNVFKGTTLRITAYKNGAYSNIITKNYFVAEEGRNRYTLPITCLSLDPDKFYSYENGLNVPGTEFDTWRINNPSTSISSMAPGNFRASGGDSEIPLNYGYYVNGEEKINQGIGLRLHGNGSRFFPNRSLRLYAKSDYGASNFNYPFFNNYNHPKFKRLILRNSGNDVLSTMFRDAFIQQSVKHLNFEIQEYQPTILFINSEYQGIYNIRERFDDKFFERKYGIDTDELDHIENHGLVSEGDNIFYHEMYNFVLNNDLSVSNNYTQLKKMMDIENFTDYYITEIFIANHDWPQNNNECWRKKVQFDSTAAYGHDGRFRWLLKDLDISFGHRYPDSDLLSNSLERVTNVTNNAYLDDANLFLRKLVANHEYKHYFVNRFSDLLNTTFLTERMISLIENISENIRPEISEFVERWNPSNMDLENNLWWAFPVYSYAAWEQNVNEMINFATLRPDIQRNHIDEQFNLNGQKVITLDISDSLKGYIKINTIEIKTSTPGVYDEVYPWSGIYFKNVPITLKAIPKEGHVFTHWSGDVSSTLDEITVNLEDTFYIKANFAICPLEDVTLTSLPNLCQNNTPHELVEGVPAGGTYSIEGVAVTSFDPSLGTQTIIYLYEDLNGCIDSDTLTVIVQPVPIIDAGDDKFVCTTESVILTGTGGAISYLWNNDVTDNTPFIPSVINT